MSHVTTMKRKAEGLLLKLDTPGSQERISGRVEAEEGPRNRSDTFDVQEF